MKKFGRIFFILLCLVTLIWTFLVYFNGLYFVDMSIFDFISSFRCDVLTYFFKFITFFASVKYIIFVCILSFIIYYYKKNKLALSLLITIVLSTIVNLGVKFIVGRDRPLMLYWLVEESNYSFPSGHSMTAMVVYGYVAMLLFKSKISRRYKVLLGVFLGFLILLIGVSRIYLGVHYFSDVIGGYLYGLIVIYICKFIMERRNLI